MAERVHVVVTTAHRGVFAGEIDPATRGESTLDVWGGQMCVYWPADVRGVLGLASHGPSKGARVTRPVSLITVHDVTVVMDTTTEARIAWESAPWG